MRRRWGMVCFTGLVSLAAVACGSSDDVEGRVGELLRTRVAAGARPSDVDRDVAAFYEGRQFRPGWTGARSRLVSGRAVVEVLEHAAEDGLDPADYDVERLRAGLEELLPRGVERITDPPELDDLAELELALTRAAFRYADHVSTGRVHPHELDIAWHTRPRDLDLVRILSDVADGEDMAERLRDLPPPHDGYVRLRDLLARLRQVEAAGGWPAVPAGPALAERARGPRVAALRARLAASGDLLADAAGGDVFDATLAQGLRRFQARHGLEPTGSADERTLSELAVPVSRRIEQVQLNMERWRWVPRSLGERYLMVNIPGFDMRVVEGAEAVLRMRVVTGKAFSPTPVFSDQMTYVVLNPYWNVPASIAAEELVPQLRRDPGALARQRIRVYTDAGEDAQELDPSAIDWSSIDPDSMKYAFRQDPGTGNSLGRMKFMLPNHFNVYLHDTPADHLFARSERDYSHGCIRLERPHDLLEYVTRGQPEWTEERVQEVLASNDETSIPLKRPLPVHILYWTAWVEEDGIPHFRDDVYRFDGALLAALERRPRGSAAVVARNRPEAAGDGPRDSR